MADISELLSGKDPDGYQKLLDLRDKLKWGNPSSSAMGPAEQSAQVFKNMPNTAAESAGVFENAGMLPSESPAPTDYKSLFGKQVAQDVVDGASLPGKTAADSAKVFAQSMPEGIAEGKNLTPIKSLVPMGESVVDNAARFAPEVESGATRMLGTAGRAIGKAAGPLSVLMELLHSTNANADEDRAVSAIRKSNGEQQTPPVDEDLDLKTKLDAFQAQRDAKTIGSTSNSSSPLDLSKMLSGGGSSGGSEGGYLPGQGPPMSFLPRSAASQQADNGGDDDEEDDDATPTGKAKPVASASLPATAPAKLTQAEAIMKFLSGNRSELAAAQAQANNTNFMANMGKAGNTIGSAFMRNGKLDDSGYDQMQKSANDPVQQVLTKHSLDKEGMQTAALKNQLMAQMDAADPSSAKSKLSTSILQQAAQAANLKLNIPPEGLSATDAKDMLSGVEGMANRRQALQQGMMMKNIMMGSKQAQSLDKAQAMIESARGAPDLLLAKRTMFLVNNAQSLLDEYKGHLNDMPGDQVELFKQEFSKIAKGGVAGEAETKGIMTITVASKIMHGLAAMGNHPTGAQMGSFLEQYTPYLQAINRNSAQVIDDRTDRIIKVHTPMVGADGVSVLRSAYPKVMDTLKQQRADQKTLSSEDKEAIAWAKSNADDPYAKQILQLHGM